MESLKFHKEIMHLYCQYLLELFLCDPILMSFKIILIWLR